MSKKSTLLIIVLVAAIAVLAGIFGKITSPKTETQVNPKDDLTKPYEEVRVVKQEPKTVLSDFPAGFPAEGGAESRDSYKYVPANSTSLQSTMEYISNKSLAENREIFATYLNTKGYNITNKIEQESLIFYYGSKPESDLSVKIESRDGKVIVTASHLKKAN